MIIAIDGPAAAGKGTLARRLAEHYGLRLDTGALYRAVGLAVMRGGGDPGDAAAAEAAARNLDPALMEDPELRAAGGAESGSGADGGSRTAGGGDGRGGIQGGGRAGRARGAAGFPAGLRRPAARSGAGRAGHRHGGLSGGQVSFEEILAQVRERDERDMNRAEAPLRPAPDAHLLDTSELDIEAAFRAARRIIDART